MQLTDCHRLSQQEWERRASESLRRSQDRRWERSNRWKRRLYVLLVTVDVLACVTVVALIVAGVIRI